VQIIWVREFSKQLHFESLLVNLQILAKRHRSIGKTLIQVKILAHKPDVFHCLLKRIAALHQRGDRKHQCAIDILSAIKYHAHSQKGLQEPYQQFLHLRHKYVIPAVAIHLNLKIKDTIFPLAKPGPHGSACTTLCASRSE